MQDAARISSPNKRIAYLDIFRYSAVTFAIISHIVIHHQIYDETASDEAAMMKAVTRAATPALLVLFGMMIELVYYRKYKTSFKGAMTSLIQRAIMCYLALVALATAFFVSGAMTAKGLVGGITLLGQVHNNDIFKLYMILLVLTLPLLFIRHRWGAIGVGAFVVTLWVGHHLLLSSLSPLPYPLGHIGSLTMGIGSGFGPSILHSSVLLVFGMALAAALLTERNSSARRSWLVLSTVIIAGALIVILHQMITYGPMGVVRKIAVIREWRNSHHLGYYAYGILAASLLLLFAVVGDRLLPARAKAAISKAGGVTLMYFFLANLLLALIPTFAMPASAISAALVLVYVAVFTALALWWARTGKNMPMANIYMNAIGALSRSVAEKLSPSVTFMSATGNSDIERASDGASNAR
ncbi:MULTISPECIES: hypothetical protein [unclassified Rhizobium]|uniref:hypothetical protein n=1 Tax=unclassified Rhizobium TaxID=2613769 RepID=UPI00288B736C|nr:MULTISPECIES: hypothetical protein [unclassified Rhizobium]